MTETGAPSEASPPIAATGPIARLRGRFDGMSNQSRGIAYVSLGSLMLVVMASIAKLLGSRLPAFELLFFRSGIGFLFMLPLFWRNPLEPFRTKRLGMHLVRGMLGSAGNFCFFWTITHMLLADSMALQFSRPLWTIPLAFFFLGEISNTRRTMVSIIGFVGVWMYARPFTEGFDPNALVGAAGALFATLVIISIKRLSTTEPTRVIMFYYAFWNAIFSFIPAMFIWVMPTWTELAFLIVLGFLGIAGQGLITKGVHYGDATALAPLDYSRIVYAAAIGYLLFGEIPGIWSIAGMLLIVAASIYLVVFEKKGAAKRA